MDPKCHTESEPINDYILGGVVLPVPATTMDAKYRLLPRKHLQMMCYSPHCLSLFIIDKVELGQTMVIAGGLKTRTCVESLFDCSTSRVYRFSIITSSVKCMPCMQKQNADAMRCT
jgi:hypothetical protein